MTQKSNSQLECQRCGHRRTFVFNHVAGIFRLLCPNGCDGSGAKR